MAVYRYPRYHHHQTMFPIKMGLESSENTPSINKIIEQTFIIINRLDANPLICLPICNYVLIQATFSFA